MKRTGFLLAAATAALLSGCGIGAPEYPQFSQASYKIEGMAASANGAAPTHTVIYRNGPLMRVEATIPQYGEAAVVFDQSTNAAYVLTSAQTLASVTPTTPTAQPGAVPAPQPALGAPPAAQQAPTTVPTAPAPSVAATPAAVGVAVKLADADAPQPMETAWAALGPDNARSTGRCEVAGEEGHQWTPRQASAGIERVACITDDGIVLRVTEDNAVLWEATSLQRGEQQAALFGVPAGYQMIDPQAVAESVSENMQQLDSVTGAPQTAPAPAPRG